MGKRLERKARPDEGGERTNESFKWIEYLSERVRKEDALRPRIDLEIDNLTISIKNVISG